MPPATSGLDAAFVQKQRQYLIRLRETLVAAAEASESDEAQVNSENLGVALE